MNKLLLGFIIFAVLINSGVIAQDIINESTNLKISNKSKTYLGLGISNSLITSLPNSSKQRIGFGLLLNSFSILGMQERLISSRFSWLSGAELSFSFHEFDGLLSTANNGIDLLKSSDSILSSMLLQSTIMVPLSLRFYFLENDHHKSNEYIQIGIKAGYGFLNGINTRSVSDAYSFSNMETVDEVNPLRYGVEFVYGSKSTRFEYFKNSSFQSIFN